MVFLCPATRDHRYCQDSYVAEIRFAASRGPVDNELGISSRSAVNLSDFRSRITLPKPHNYFVLMLTLCYTCDRRGVLRDIKSALHFKSKRFGALQGAQQMARFPDMSLLFLLVAAMIGFSTANVLTAPPLDTGNPKPIRIGGQDISTEPGWRNSAFRSHMWWLSGQFSSVHVTRGGYESGMVGLLTTPAGAFPPGFSRDLTQPALDLTGISSAEYDALLALNRAIPEAVILCRKETDGPKERCTFRAIWPNGLESAQQVQFVGALISKNEMAVIELGLLQSLVAGQAWREG